MIATTKGQFFNDVLVNGEDLDIPESAVIYISNKIRDYLDTADISESEFEYLLGREGDKATHSRYFVIYLPSKLIEITAFIDINNRDTNEDYFINIHRVHFNVTKKEVLENACPILGL
jgi:hypothetical protein